ncbi:unnamed protein product, partial [Pylaiella littoralis]
MLCQENLGACSQRIFGTIHPTTSRIFVSMAPSSPRLTVCYHPSGNSAILSVAVVVHETSLFDVTLSMLLASKDHPHACQLCLCDVGGYPS